MPALRGARPVVVDTRDADHEAGDLLQAGLDVSRFADLRDVIARTWKNRGPVLFKSCGWAGWDLAAARAALAASPERGRERRRPQALGSVTPSCPWYLPPRSL